MRQIRPHLARKAVTPVERRVRFEALYGANCDRVLAYALRRLDRPEDAADVTAETFLTAWRRLDDVPCGEDAHLWLYGVARRVLANHRRGERRRTALANQLRARLAVATPAIEYAGDLAMLADALRALPDGDREILMLEGWEGLDPGEIAAVLGCSRNAARIRLHRARRRLERLLSPAADPQPSPSRPHTFGGEPT